MRAIHTFFLLENLLMKILSELLAATQDGEIMQVLIGVHWTAVVASVYGEKRCGLASTLHSDHYHGMPDVPQAGILQQMPAAQLAKMALSEQGILASVGIATLNALLPRFPHNWVDLNAEEVIAKHGAGKTVAIIGSFPFSSRIESRLGKLYTIERNPEKGDHPEEAAPEILPQADLVALTGMTLINHSLEKLLTYCSPKATLMLLGPSTPLSPVLFEHGIDLVSGSIVTDVDPVLQAITQGANFRQVHRAGVRLVTIRSDTWQS
jgi:uncharacterized protein (DUF4213/DUF364 family)